jgi:hypothetical protein
MCTHCVTRVLIVELSQNDLGLIAQRMAASERTRLLAARFRDIVAVRAGALLSANASTVTPLAGSAVSGAFTSAPSSPSGIGSSNGVTQSSASADTGADVVRLLLNELIVHCTETGRAGARIIVALSAVVLRCVRVCSGVGGVGVARALSDAVCRSRSHSLRCARAAASCASASRVHTRCVCSYVISLLQYASGAPQRAALVEQACGCRVCVRVTTLCAGGATIRVGRVDGARADTGARSRTAGCV